MRNSLAGVPPTSAAIFAAINAVRSAPTEPIPVEHKAFIDGVLPPRALADSPAWDSSDGAREPVAADSLRVADVWYIDDSCVRAAPLDGDLWLAAWDLNGAAVGVRRSMAKSLVRGRRHGDVIPPYSAATCREVPHDQPVKWLGVRLGDTSNQLAEKIDEAAALHEAIAELEDPALELVLTRATAEVSKIVYLLRAVGPGDDRFDALIHAPLAAFDQLMRNAVGRIVRTDPGDDATEQATWGVRAGGLGLRKATAVAWPANVASLVECEHLVVWLTRECERLGAPGPPPPVSHSARTSAAVAAFLASIDGEKTRDAVAADVEKARSAADLAGDPPILRERPPAASRSPPRPAPTDMVQDVGDGDPDKGPARRAAKLQHRILAVLDEASRRAVIDPLKHAPLSDLPARERLRRLEDIAGRDVSHDWLWSINPAHGPVLPPDDYITATRLRLGIPLASYDGTRPCNECHQQISARDLGPHALSCARGRRVLGHNALRDHLLSLARASDPRARLEVPLGPSLPDAHLQRPADILLSASPLGNGAGPVAVDVGIVSPTCADALTRAVDPLETYIEKKKSKSLALCRDAGWGFFPFVLSAFGRPHPAASRLVHALAVRAAREFVADPAPRLEDAWWRNATTLLMARAASMVERCRPLPPDPRPVDGRRDAMWGVEPHPPLPRSPPHPPDLHEVVTGADAPVSPYE